MKFDAALKFLRALPGIKITDHWGNDAFNAHGRIFATACMEKNRVNLRLSLDEQERFVKKDADAFMQIDNAWGRQGWTTCWLGPCSKTLFEQAAKSAFKLSELKNPNVPVVKAAKRPSARSRR